MRNVCTVVSLNVVGRKPQEVSLIHSCVTVRSASAEVNLLTLSCMTNHSASCFTRECPYVSCRCEAYFVHLLCDRPFLRKQCFSLFKVSGDTNTPLCLSGHREIPTIIVLLQLASDWLYLGPGH